MGHQYRKLIQLAFLDGFVCMNCYYQLQQVLASKDVMMTLWREQLPSSAHQQTLSAALELREKVFILKPCLSSLIFIPCQNQTQQNNLFGQMEAKAVILYSFILLIFWVLFSLTCPQTAHFIFPIPKFPTWNSVLCDSSDTTKLF